MGQLQTRVSRESGFSRRETKKAAPKDGLLGYLKLLYPFHVLVTI